MLLQHLADAQAHMNAGGQPHELADAWQHMCPRCWQPFCCGKLRWAERISRLAYAPSLISLPPPGLHGRQINRAVLPWPLQVEEQKLRLGMLLGSTEVQPMLLSELLVRSAFKVSTRMPRQCTEQGHAQRGL